MAEHDEVYGEERAMRLAALLRSLAARIRELDEAGQLLRGGPELLRMMGDARSELFHYEVRSTYYTLFAVLAVVGLGVLGYLVTRPATVSIPANVTVQPSDTSGFAGYVKGSPSAPVEITEFADYQCPL